MVAARILCMWAQHYSYTGTVRRLVLGRYTIAWGRNIVYTHSSLISMGVAYI
jgi:hypothetical protein